MRNHPIRQHYKNRHKHENSYQTDCNNMKWIQIFYIFFISAPAAQTDK